jgi:hypothetical protein
MDYMQMWLDVSQRVARLEAAIATHRLMKAEPDDADTFLWTYTEVVS